MCQGSENAVVKLLQVMKAKRPIADTAVKTIGGCIRTLTVHMMTRYLTQEEAETSKFGLRTPRG